jgi:hypothetical protein
MSDHGTEHQTAQTLARGRRAYDQSCAGGPKLVGSITPTPEPDDRVDVDQVRRARETLWLRIPPVHRARQSELARRSGAFLSAALAWDWGSPCLLMSAPTDAGKSSAAALVLLRLMAKGREADWRLWRGIRWFGANELMGAAREWPLGNGACPEVRAASTCGLLVLDDLGNEQEWQTTMFDLLQARYERQLPNIVTTGMRPSELLARYGDAILRRLAQRDGKLGTIVDLRGEP